jgi:MFS family permease
LCGILTFLLPSAASDRADAVEHSQPRALQRFVEDLRETWRFLAADSVATMAMLLLTVGATLTLITAMLAPRYMVSVVGIRADDTVYVLAPAGVGMAIGAAIIGRFSRWVPKELISISGTFAVGVGILLLGVVSPIWNFVFLRLFSLFADPATLPRVVSLVTGVMVIAALTGFALSMMIISAQTVLQERAPVETRGRVFAAQIMLGNMASIIPLVFIGQLADWIGVPLVLGLLALTIFVLGFTAVRSYRARVWGDALK